MFFNVGYKSLNNHSTKQAFTWGLSWDVRWSYRAMKHSPRLAHLSGSNKKDTEKKRKKEYISSTSFTSRDVFTKGYHWLQNYLMVPGKTILKYNLSVNYSVHVHSLVPLLTVYSVEYFLLQRMCTRSSKTKLLRMWC